MNKTMITAAAVLGTSPAFGAFSIDFRDATWNHSAVGGPAASVGWGSPTPTGAGYLSGTTDVGSGVILTVTTTVRGTAQAATDNFRRDVANTPGFAIGNRGTQDRNTVVGSNPPVYTGAVTLQNYQKVTFSFSAPVVMDFLQVADIDTTNTTASVPQAWRDAVGIEYWTGSEPLTPGSGTNPTITALGSRLTQNQSANGLNYAWASTIGNTNTSNPAAANDPSSVTFSSSGTGIDGFTMYIWNAGAGTGGKHSVVLQAGGNTLTVIPEPSSAILILLGGLLLGRRRSR